MKPKRWWVPDLTDVHVYGGALLMSTGAGLWNTWAGLLVLGGILFTLGIRRG